MVSRSKCWSSRDAIRSNEIGLSRYGMATGLGSRNFDNGMSSRSEPCWINEEKSVGIRPLRGFIVQMMLADKVVGSVLAYAVNGSELTNVALVLSFAISWLGISFTACISTQLSILQFCIQKSRLP